MREWKTLSVPEFADVVSGATPATNVIEYWDGDIEWITPVDLSKLNSRFLNSSVRKISKKGLENSSTCLIPAYNVVMSSRAPIGYFAIPTRDFTTNQGCKSFKLFPSQDAEYHYYNFLLNIDYFKRFGSGSTFAEISKSDIEKLSFTIPTSLPEQRKIARILSTVDAVIEKTEAAIAKYKAIKAGMMHDLFTRGIDVATGKLRPSYEEAPELYKLSALGWVPKGWEVERLREITLKIADRDHYTPKYLEFGIPIISPKDFDDEDNIIFEKCSHVSLEEHTHNMQKTDIRPNDLIFTRIGALLGKIALVTPIMPQFSILHSACLIRANERIICPEYLCFFIKSFIFQMQIKSEIQSIGVPDLGLDKIGAFTIPYPKNINEQKCISRKFESIFLNISYELNTLRKHQQLKQALMSDLLTGKVRVKYKEEKPEAI